MLGNLTHTHAFILASPDENARSRRALELACAFVCESDQEKPCLQCQSCKNTLMGFHPDVAVIARKTDDKGKTKREIQVDQIRQMRADAYVRPQQADKKVYIIQDAETMNGAAQNAALKILEEPPGYAVFILCTDSAQALLPTIRSRCAVIQMQGEPERAENPLAETYLALAARKETAGLCAFIGKNEGLDPEQAAAFVCSVRSGLSDILLMKKSLPGLLREDAMRLIALCDKAEAYLRLNVGVKHVMGLFCVLTI